MFSQIGSSVAPGFDNGASLPGGDTAGQDKARYSDLAICSTSDCPDDRCVPYSTGRPQTGLWSSSKIVSAGSRWTGTRFHATSQNTLIAPFGEVSFWNNSVKFSRPFTGSVRSLPSH